MNVFDFEYRIYVLAALHCAVGIIAALVAQRKGYSLKPWLIIGIIGGTPSLIFALTRPVIEPDDSGN